MSKRKNSLEGDSAVEMKLLKLAATKKVQRRFSARLKQSVPPKHSVIIPKKSMKRSGTTTVLHQHNPITAQPADTDTVELEPSSQLAIEHRQIVPDKSLMAPPSSDIQNGNGCSQSPSDMREPTKDETTDSDGGSRENSPESDVKDHENGNNGEDDSKVDENEKPNDESATTSKPIHDDEITIKVDENDEKMKNEYVSPSSSTVSSSFDTNCQNQPSPSTSIKDQSILPAESARSVPSSAETSKRTRTRKPAVVEEASRKSNRINRCVEAAAEVVENYTEAKLDKPRSVQIPIGISRKPYCFPRKTSKEKDRLRIDMKGPSTRANPSDVLYTPLSKIQKSHEKYVKKESKAVVPDLLPIEQALEEMDRDEPIWASSDCTNLPAPDVLDPILTIINFQYEGTIPFDAVLRRLMIEGYDIDRMLETIELERERLPQPFEPFSYVQQMEYQKMLSRIYGSSIRPYKTFRGMQEKFLRGYHLGEIVEYYYKTKRRGCSRKLYTRCGCQEELVSVPSSIIERVECENCTSSMRPMAVGTDKFCGICKLFFDRNNRHRKPCGMFTDREMNIINMWRKMEEEEGGERVSLEEVRARIEAERVAELTTRKLTTDEVELIRLAPAKERQNAAKLLSTFDVNRVKTCTASADSLEFRIKDYDRAEKKKFVFAIEKFGKDFEKIGTELNVSKEEVAHFFHRFNSQYQFTKMIANIKKTVYLKDRYSRESTPFDVSEKTKKNNRKRGSDQYSAGAPKRKNGKYGK